MMTERAFNGNRIATKRVFIGVGHGGKDPGAVKYVKESEANLQMALGMKEELEKYGITVGISRTREEDDPLSEEIKEANAFKPDIAVEVHNNAGGGDGFEVYYQTNGYKAQSMKLAQCIEARVKASGQKSRGIKTKLNSSGTDYFGWCRQVNCPAVLCEGFFVDNAADSADYNTTAEQKAYGKVYALGVLDYLGIKENPQTGAQPPQTTPQDKPESLPYTVQVGAFTNRVNAASMQNKLSGMGYYAFVTGENSTDRVCVGKFADKGTAQKTADDLKKKGIAGFVTTI